MTHTISLAASPVPVSQPCTMENSKCSKGNSRSLWPGPVILVRVLPLFFLEYPRATCHDFHPHRYILPVAIVAMISRRREIYIISFPRDRGRIRPLVPSPSYRDFFSTCIFTSDSYIQMQMVSASHFIKLLQQL